jgi:hypothetical protein
MPASWMTVEEVARSPPGTPPSRFSPGFLPESDRFRASRPRWVGQFNNGCAMSFDPPSSRDSSSFLREEATPDVRTYLWGLTRPCGRRLLGLTVDRRSTWRRKQVDDRSDSSRSARRRASRSFLAMSERRRSAERRPGICTWISAFSRAQDRSGPLRPGELKFRFLTGSCWTDDLFV